MKGIIFNLLEEIVRDKYGEDAWDELLESANLDGAYASLGSYPDADMKNLVAAAAARLKMSEDQVVRWVGREALPRTSKRYPHFFTPHANARSFVLTLNDIIHPEVRKLYPGADVPDFTYEQLPDILVMHYRSHRKMCAFAHGMVEGAADYFREVAHVTQSLCMHRGDAECTFEIAFSPAQVNPAIQTLKLAA